MPIGPQDVARGAITDHLVRTVQERKLRRPGVGGTDGQRTLDLLAQVLGDVRPGELERYNRKWGRGVNPSLDISGRRHGNR